MNDHDQGAEAEIARRKIAQYASERNVPVDEFVQAIIVRSNEVEAKKGYHQAGLEHLNFRIKTLKEEVSRLRAILKAHGIEYAVG